VIQAPVLLVEDEIDIRETARDLLELEGFEVLVAEHGREALDLLETGAEPGVIFLDLAMPVMTGGELLERLQASERLRRIPVVVVSGYADVAPAGAVACVTKPARVEVLLALARRHCRPAPAAAGP
jgi:CheY-like chemotaxis protein